MKREMIFQLQKFILILDENYFTWSYFKCHIQGLIAESKQVLQVLVQKKRIVKVYFLVKHMKMVWI